MVEEFIIVLKNKEGYDIKEGVNCGAPTSNGHKCYQVAIVLVYI